MFLHHILLLNQAGGGEQNLKDYTFLEKIRLNTLGELNDYKIFLNFWAVCGQFTKLFSMPHS